MIKAKFENLIGPADRSWAKRKKVPDKTITVKEPSDLVSEIEKYAGDSRQVQLIGGNKVNVKKLKTGDVLKCYFGGAYKLFAQITIITAMDVCECDQNMKLMTAEKCDLCLMPKDES